MKFVKENLEKNLKEINVMLVERWKFISEEEKLKYKEFEKIEFQQKIDKWSKVQEDARVVEQLQL